MDEVTLDGAAESSSSSSTTRLRRRSFYENMETEASAFAPPPPPDSVQASGDAAATASPRTTTTTTTSSSSTITSNNTISNTSSSSSSSVLPAADDDASATAPLLASPSAASSSSSSPGASHGYRGGVAGALAQWLLASVLTLLYRLQRWLRVRLRLHERAPFRFVRMLRERSAAAAAVKHWAYPTHWLTLGCVTLVAAQVVVYWHFQLELFDLRVKECVFHEQLMPAAHVPGVARAGSAGAATRYLERRFEQLHDHAGRVPKNKPRLPWTCVALVAADDRARATTAELALLLPRHRLLEPSAAVASRLQLVVGGAPVARSAHAGVVGALFPLGAFRDALFPQGFPDLVLVKTEFALKRMLRHRQTRQEELLHNVPHGGGGGGALDDRHTLARSQFGILLTKATVPDVYQRRVPKNWDAFLHVVAVSTQDKAEQFTKELLAAWVQHPQWPTLHVRFPHSLELCGSFVRYLSNLQSRRRDEVEGDENDEDDAKGDAPSNVDVSCAEADNSRSAIVEMKNRIGMHLFPTPPEADAYEELALESLAVGAMVITYNTPVMQEWVPDACGLRVGSFELSPASSDAGALSLPVVRVTASEIERAVEAFLGLDHVNRVAKGRAARVQYLRLRAHFLSAMAALDAAVCDDDTDDAIEVPSDIGHRSRTKVEMETLRVFLY